MLAEVRAHRLAEDSGISTTKAPDRRRRLGVVAVLAGRAAARMAVEHGRPVILAEQEVSGTE